MLFRRHGQSLVVHTPAKLNLFLEIFGKRADGYHELETLMVSVGVCDTLSFTEGISERIRLRCFNAGTRGRIGEMCDVGIGADRNNLVVRAAHLLQKYTGVRRGVCVDLRKRIPVAAGLAGGSSDAAATLVALNRFWGLELTLDELQQLASHLGSDVGFFLSGASAAICRGRGEEIEPLDLPLGLHFVIARPKSGLPTAVVYQHCQASDNPRSARRLAECLKQGRLGHSVRYLYNALQAPAEQLNREITQLKARFSRQPVLGHMMSGSGSAYFGICAHRRQALQVGARLRAMQLGPVFAARSGP